MKSLKKLAVLLMVLTMSACVAYGAVACGDGKDNSSSSRQSTNLDDNDVPDPWDDSNW